MTPIRVLVVDDHAVFAEAISTALGLESDIEVLGLAGSVRDGIAMVEENEPDVLLLDYELPDGHGTEICARARALRPQCHVVMLTQFDAQPVVIESIRAGASAFLPKTSSLGEVAAAVRGAHEGESLLPASALQGLMDALRRSDSKQPSPHGGVDLTPREWEILRLIGDGYANAAIAERLVVSPHTVRTHVQNVLKKLGVHSKLEAVALALRLNLLPGPGTE